MGYNKNTGLYEVEDISFVNTREFTRTADHFRKYGCYTKAHPKYDKAEYDAFWDEEEKRRRFGYSVGGVKITGKHYGFLNYARIRRTNDPDDTKGIFKDYKNARKVGEKQWDFPDFWDGHYQWFTAKQVARKLGLHVIGGKARRKGFSYVGAWDAADTYDLHPGSTTIIGAYDNKFLIRGDGTMAMAKRYLDFLNKYTDWYKGRIVNSKDWIKSGYKPKGKDEEYGFLSQILSISFSDNADAAAGKDARDIQLEELGIFPNLRDVLDITLPTLEDGINITGQIAAWGTGGTKDANWEVFEEIFYNPLKFRFMAFDNVWDDNARGSTCGFFFPHIQNLVGFIDENGNSRKKEALVFSEERREEHRAIANDIHSHNLWCGQRANKPSEAFSRSTSNVFSSKELSDHIHAVKHDPDLKWLGRPGIFVRTDKGVRFVTNAELKGQGLEYHEPITSFPNRQDQDPHGCYMEFQPPYRDPKTGKVPKGLIRIWNDPYAHDKDTKEIQQRDSYGCTYVYERINPYTSSRGDILIGVYYGRPPKSDIYNEQLLMLCEYCGGEDGILMFENDRGDVKRYFTARKALHLLADEPEITWKKELQSTKTGRTKGIMVNPGRKGTGAIYLRDWIYEVRGTDENGVRKLNLHYINDLGLLQELEKWNVKGNFDRVSTMIVGMYDMKEEFEKEIEMMNIDNETSFFDRELFKN